METVSLFNYLVAAYFGLILGNFATSFYFRIPRSIPILGFNYFNSVPPHCSHCKHPLKLKEFAPIVGYLLCRGKCSYCSAKIDQNYFIIEAFSLALSLFCYSQFYFLDWYLIFMLFGISSLVMSMVLQKHQKVEQKFIGCVIICGAIYSTLVDMGIYDWVFKLAMSSIASILVIQYSYKHSVINKYLELFKILFVAFIWFDLNLMMPYALFILTSYFLFIRYQFIFAKYIYHYSYLIMFFIILINHLAKV